MDFQALLTRTLSDRHVFWMRLGAAMSAKAGIANIVASPFHFSPQVTEGLFLLLVAVAQLLFALRLLRRGSSRGWLLVGILGNFLILGLYAASAMGVSFFGAEAASFGSVRAVDVFSKFYELALIACLFAALRARSAPRAVAAAPHAPAQSPTQASG